MHILGYGDIIVTIVFFLFGAAFVSAVRFNWIPRDVLIKFLIFKFVLCIAFNLYTLYTEQTYDATGYFREGGDFSQMIGEMMRGTNTEYLTTTPFFGTDGTNTERFTSFTGLLLVLTGGTFLGCNLVMCCLGATGQILVFRYLRRRFPDADYRYFYLVLFHPSLALWSSSLCKDTIGIFSLGVAIYNIDVCLSRFNLRSLFTIVLALYFAFLFRAYVVLMIVIFLIFAYWDRKLEQSNRGGAMAGLVRPLYIPVALAISIFGLIYFVRSKGEDMAELQQYNDDGYAQMEGDSTFRNATLSVSVGGLAALPLGAMNAIFRPFLWEVRKPNQLLAALENLAVVWLLIRSWRVFLYSMPPDLRRNVRSVMYGGALVSVITASGIGLYSSNMGTISRYRIPIIPMLLAGPCAVLGLTSSKRCAGFRAGLASGRGELVPGRFRPAPTKPRAFNYRPSGGTAS